MKRSDRRSSRGKNGDDTGWVRLKLPIATDPGQIQYAVDRGKTDITVGRELVEKRRLARSQVDTWVVLKLQIAVALRPAI